MWNLLPCLLLSNKELLILSEGEDRLVFGSDICTRYRWCSLQDSCCRPEMWPSRTPQRPCVLLYPFFLREELLFRQRVSFFGSNEWPGQHLRRRSLFHSVVNCRKHCKLVQNLYNQDTDFEPNDILIFFKCFINFNKITLYYFQNKYSNRITMLVLFVYRNPFTEILNRYPENVWLHEILVTVQFRERA